MSVIRIKANPTRRPTPKHGKSRRAQMTDDDWDKFEKDITDAFEQVP